MREGSNIFAEGWPPQAARGHGGGRAARGDGGRTALTVSDLEMGKTWYFFSFPVIISSNSGKLGTDLKRGNDSPGVATFRRIVCTGKSAFNVDIRFSYVRF